MKKLLLLLMVASFSIAGTATAQKKSHKNCGNDKNKYSKKYDRRMDDRRDDNYDRRNVGYNNNNAPRKVRDAFYRDYPNANNVSWSKDRGVWTARFKNGGLFGGNRSVSYAANGRRMDNNNNGIFGRRDDNRTAKRSDRKTIDDLFDRQ